MAGPLPLLTTESVYKKLQDYHKENGDKINIKQLFDKDPERFNKFRYVCLTYGIYIHIPPRTSNPPIGRCLTGVCTYCDNT